MGAVSPTPTLGLCWEKAQRARAQRGAASSRFCSSARGQLQNNSCKKRSCDASCHCNSSICCILAACPGIISLHRGISSERQGRRSGSRSWAGDSRSSTALYISNEGCLIPVPSSLHIHTLLWPPRAHAQQRNCSLWEVADACPMRAIKHCGTFSSLEFGSNQSVWGIYGYATPMHLII